MNTVAYEENLRNRRHIRKTNCGGCIINTRKITYENRPWHALSSVGKRKLENRIFFEYPKEKLHFIYE